MWYVVWTSTGSERKAKEALENKTNRCFYPTRVINHKYKGEWITEEKPLFPGYIFVDTDDIKQLAKDLWTTEGFTKILDTDKKYYDLYDKDEEFIENLYSDGGLFDVSKGILEGDHIKVTAGPLVGMEGCITKINRHKRIAFIELNMFGQSIKTSVGLEIVE